MKYHKLEVNGTTVTYKPHCYVVITQHKRAIAIEDFNEIVSKLGVLFYKENEHSRINMFEGMENVK